MSEDLKGHTGPFLQDPARVVPRESPAPSVEVPQEEYEDSTRRMPILQGSGTKDESSQTDSVVKKAVVCGNTIDGTRVTFHPGNEDQHTIEVLHGNTMQQKREKLDERLDVVDEGDKRSSDTIALSQQHLIPVRVPHGNHTSLQEKRGDISLPDTPGLNDTKSALYAPGKFSYEELRSIVNQSSEQTKTSHRLLLFEMFFQFSSTEFDSLAAASGIRLGDILSKTRNDRKRRRDNDDNRKSYDKLLVDENNDTTLSEPLAKKRIKGPELIALIPLALSTNKKILLQLTKRGMADSLNAPVQSTNVGDNGNSRRKNHQSLTLSVLESSVLSSFESSSVGINAIATKNPLYDRFLKSNEQMGIMPPPLLVQPAKNKFLAVSLKYNECSMTAFARWAQSSDGGFGDRNASLPSLSGQYSSGSQIPASRVLFHRCQICESWGHYELECDRMVESNTLSKVADELGVQQRIRKFEAEEKQHHCVIATASRSPQFCSICKYNVTAIPAPFMTCKGCKVLCHHDCVGSQFETATEVDWLCQACCIAEKLNEGFDSIVNLEGCDGFVIEQRTPSAKSDNSVGDSCRSPSMGIGFGNVSWSKAISLSNGKHVSRIVSRKAKEAAKLVVPEKSDLDRAYVIGEFCWVKRMHASKGKLARDEWWPAQVMTLTTHMKHAEYFKGDVTPYTVRLFAVQNANRIRASHIVPFFKHFRAIGYQRLKVQKPNESAQDRNFRRGVEEVIHMMGYNSLAQILAHSDEELTREITLCPEAPERRAVKVETPANFTTSFRQDGFTIRVEEIDRKPKSSYDLKKKKKVLPKPKRNHVASFSRSKLAGCVVAWASAQECETVMHVGIVQAANIKTKFALVSMIPDWKEKLVPSTSTDGVVICNHRCTSVEWIAMNRLHMIANGPEEGCKQEIWEEVISDVVEAARIKAVAQWKKGVISCEEKATLFHQQHDIHSPASTIPVNAKHDAAVTETAHLSSNNVVASLEA